MFVDNDGDHTETSHAKPKHIQPDEKVGLKITAAERNLLCEDVTFLDDEYPDAIRQTPADQPVKFTLADWDDLGGYIAAEANHTEDRRLKKKLDAIFDKIQEILDTYTDEEPPKTVKIEEARKAKVLSQQAAKITNGSAECLGPPKSWKSSISRSNTSGSLLHNETFSGLVPNISKEIKDKLTKDKAPFTVADVAAMTIALAEDLPTSQDQKQVAFLLVGNHLMDRLQDVLGPSKPKANKVKKPKAKVSASTIFQFKITLKGIEPPIWRRIQVKDCTLDKLHEHIQTAMGWTNSHLHQFKIGGVHLWRP